MPKAGSWRSRRIASPAARLRADDRGDPRPGRRASRPGSASRARVGIGTPGAVSPASGLVKNANSTQLNGQPLVADLAHALGREVRVANDADCFALSEASDGAGAGRRVVFGVILGTGVGGGLVVDGRLWVGPNAIAGEWGHNELPSRTEAGPARHALLLRPPPLHRDLPVGPGARRRSRPRRRPRRRPTSMRGGSSPSPAPATRRRRPRWTATAGAWRARSPP